MFMSVRKTLCLRCTRCPSNLTSYPLSLTLLRNPIALKGINLESYFLSFARLARRSAVFWGHAVTSGVTAADAVPIQNGGPGALGGTDGRVADVGGADHNRLGGVDYFVSSWLFEDESLGRLAQRKYSER